MSKPPDAAFAAYFCKTWNCGQPGLSKQMHMHGPNAIRFGWEADEDVGGFWRAAQRETARECRTIANERAFPHYMAEATANAIAAEITARFLTEEE